MGLGPNVLVHVDTDCASEKLVNRRLAYVAVSRGQYDARIYTDDKVKLSRALDRNISHPSALERKAAAPSYGPGVVHESGDRSGGQTMEISR